MDVVFKIMNEEKSCFQHVKSVTRPITEFYCYLAAKPNLVSRQVFSLKDSYGHYLSYATLGSSVAVMVAV